jgi:hypothetical protein
MTPQTLELAIIIGACLLISAGVAAWSAIIYFTHKLKKILARVETIVDDINEQENLRSL